MKLKHRRFSAKVMLVALATTLAACDPANPNQTQQERSALLELDLWSKTDPTFNAIATHFPQEWSGIREQLARDYANSVSRDEVFQAASQHVREFTGSKATATAVAPASALVDMIKAERDLLKALQIQDAVLCAKFASGNEASTVEISEDNLHLLSAAGQKRVMATRFGLDDPQERGDPTVDDTEALAAAVTQNLASSGAGPDLKVDTKTGAPQKALSEQDQCQLAIATYNAMASMPEDQASRLYAKHITQNLSGSQ